MKSKQYINKNKCTSFIVCLSLTGYIFITCNQNLEHIKVNLFWLFRNDLSCSVYYSSLFSKCITWYFFPKWKRKCLKRVLGNSSLISSTSLCKFVTNLHNDHPAMFRRHYFLRCKGETTLHVFPKDEDVEESKCIIQWHSSITPTSHCVPVILFTYYFSHLFIKDSAVHTLFWPACASGTQPVIMIYYLCIYFLLSVQNA